MAQSSALAQQSVADVQALTSTVAFWPLHMQPDQDYFRDYIVVSKRSQIEELDVALASGSASCWECKGYL